MLIVDYIGITFDIVVLIQRSSFGYSVDLYQKAYNSKTAGRCVKQIEICNSGVLVVEHIWSTSDLKVFKVIWRRGIRCTSLKMDCNSKTADHRVKESALWDCGYTKSI